MWFVLSLIVGLAFTANRLIIRSVFTKNAHPMAFGALHELLAGLFLMPIGLFYFSLPQSPKTWLALCLGIFLIFLTDLFAFLSLRKLEISLYQIISQLRHVIVLFGAYFLFSENLTVTKIVAIFLIMFGIYVAMKGKPKFSLTKETIYALFSTTTISFGLLFIKMANIDVAPAFSAALSFTIGGLLIGLVLLVRGEHPLHFIPKEHKKELFIAAGLFSIFELALFTALKIGEASRVTPVTQSTMIFTLIGGYLFLNERSHIKKKIFGSVFIVAGIILMYLM